MTTNKVIDIRTKKSANLITQSDEDQVNWLVNELCGVINKAEKKKFNALNISIALAEVVVDYVHEVAPDTLSAQHLLTTAIQKTLGDKMEKRLEDRNE